MADFVTRRDPLKVVKNKKLKWGAGGEGAGDNFFDLMWEAGKSVSVHILPSFTAFVSFTFC